MGTVLQSSRPPGDEGPSFERFSGFRMIPSTQNLMAGLGPALCQLLFSMREGISRAIALRGERAPPTFHAQWSGWLGLVFRFSRTLRRSVLISGHCHESRNFCLPEAQSALGTSATALVLCGRFSFQCANASASLFRTR